MPAQKRSAESQFPPLNRVWAVAIPISAHQYRSCERSKCARFGRLPVSTLALVRAMVAKWDLRLTDALDWP